MKVARRYGLVRVIAFILKLLAWLVLLAGIAASIGGMVIAARPVGAVSDLARVLGSGTAIASIVMGILWFVPLFAFGSILSLLLDIEENTRALASVPPTGEMVEVRQP